MHHRESFAVHFAAALGLMICTACVGGAAAGAAEPLVSVDRDGQLTYRRDEHGNCVPDFSACGYALGERDIPEPAALVAVAPGEGDDDARIQAALDFAATQPASEHGARGAVQLLPGEFQIAGQLRVPGGVVLRGAGAGAGGTVLLATGIDRRAVMRIEGGPPPAAPDEPLPVVDAYVPVGSIELTLPDNHGLTIGDRVIVTRPSTAEWIEQLGCGPRVFGVGWRAGSRDLQWDRTIADVDGPRVTLDAAITVALDQGYGGGAVARRPWPERLQEAGVEDLTIKAAVDPDRPLDEDHAWFGVAVDNAADCWIRRVRFEHLAGGAVVLGPQTTRVSVVDCLSLAPVSELGGYRRHAFFTRGQLGLFLRCWSEDGRHDFSTGFCAAGPNAFVSCRTRGSRDYSGPIESLSAGVLYDNVRIDGHDLRLVNNWAAPTQAGWSATNCLLWQCRAANVRCFAPPGANNWCVGAWANVAGDGVIESVSDIVRPLSLYQAQLAQRVGAEAARRVDPVLGKSIAATSPTYDEAAAFVAQSNEPARQLIDVIEEKIAAAQELRLDEAEQASVTSGPPPLQGGSAGQTDRQSGVAQNESLPRPLPSREGSARVVRVENGWLTVEGGVLVGRRMTPSWWRGTVLADAEKAAQMGRNVTRFAPGRWGAGWTDGVDDVAAAMRASGAAAYEHHYGLWYDRRRDDHLMVRRADGDVTPPFYEQPFARSGQGTAWDGLSKYDLTRFNPWYWSRLGQLADRCDEAGMVLLHQNYFQHNILEAGAHWVDCPWRPANNVNATGLPEPPPFVGDKRLFMAHNFYDPANKPLRELHRGYIRQCLDAFADNPNVIQLTSAEYTGPLEFVQFWLDVIAEWQAETGRDPLIALSCTKDVQDAILADARRAAVVDVIDIRYWTYDEHGELYAPAGGVNLAPRQHMRQLQPEASSFASIVRAVRECRTRHPNKAVTYFASDACRSGEDGWAVLIGGGSLASVRLPEDVRSAVAAMQPAEGMLPADAGWALAAGEAQAVVYLSDANAAVKVGDLAANTAYNANWLDERTGQIVETQRYRTNNRGELTLKPGTQACWLQQVD
ncbi:MAG: pectate lyase [Planctomycetaceae bacterium]|nr:pectate lyase [Planctomycetaceae bacterium]